MKILVTGGGGFLGSSLVKRLLEGGYALKSLGRSAQPEHEAAGVEVVRGDLTDPAVVRTAVSGCDAVFHVAAKAGIWGKQQAYFKTNVLGTRHLIAACQREGLRALVYTSTPSVVFSGDAFRGADESLPRTQGTSLSHYATTKAQAEEEVLKAHEVDGLRVCAIRPHLIWGVGDPHLIPRVIDRARKGRLRMVGAGKNQVSVTHIENAVSAHLLALDALLAGRAGGQAYFIADEQPVVLWAWINDLLNRLGEPSVSQSISFKMAYRMGALLEAMWTLLPLPGEPPMTRFVATELSKDHWFDTSAARRDLNYESVISNEVGLVELVQAYKATKDRGVDKNLSR